MSTINLSKGMPAVFMKKTAKITVSASWPASTDYDLYALVVLRNGQVEHVAMFGASGVHSHEKYRGVKHSGDAARGVGTSTETLTIEMDDSIAAVVPVAYSAQSNGTGSFYKYKVSLAVDNGAGDRVEISAGSANNDNRVYSCVPAIIHNNVDGTVSIEPVEQYSQRSSERRPSAEIQNGRVIVTMDAGPRNNYK